MKKNILTLLMVCYIPFLLYSQNWEITHYTNTTGLTNSSINCIFQDSAQVMWIGSWDGLHSFNGRDFKVYKYDPDDEYSISNNIIKEIIEQDSRRIWISTTLGINLFDKQEEKFYRFNFGLDTHILQDFPLKISKGIDNTIFCVVSGWSLTYYNEARKEFIALNIPQIKDFDIHFFKSDNAGNLFFLDGLGDLYKVKTFKDEQGSVSVASCTLVDQNISFKGIFSKSGNDFWLLDDKNNLYLYNSINGIIHYVTQLPSGENIDNRIVDMTNLNEQTLIAYSLSGLHIFDPAGNTIKPFDAVKRQGLNCLFWSRQQILWIGTDGNGLIALYEPNMKFNLVRNSDIQKKWTNAIRGFCEDKDGNIWVANKGNGIAIMSNEAGEGLKYRDAILTENNAVYSIINGLGGDMLIGSDGQGVSVYNKFGKITKIDLSGFVSREQEFKSSYSMYLDKEKNILWIGTNGHGLIKITFEYAHNKYNVLDYKVYSASTGSSISNSVYTVIPEDEHHLWLATRGRGVNLLDTRNDKVAIYNKAGIPALSDDDVLCLIKTRIGTVWAGTSYGLNRIDYHNGQISIKKYTESSGLPNNTIHGIVEDDAGILWLSTNNGISKFDTNTEEIVNYRNGYNLQSNEFADGAYYKSRDGRIFFGGIDGFNYFNPKDIKERPFSPKLMLTGFKLNSGNRNILNRIAEDEGRRSVRLKYDENFFNINFIALDYINNPNCEYRYMLEGFNDNWISEAGNSATFTNVHPGKYNFRLRSTNGDKIWQDNEYVLQIIVEVPWWRTWWAYIIYVVLVAGVVYMAYRTVRKRLALKQSLLLEKLEKKEQQQIHEAKLRFFTNIAHEFSTPLTLIYGPCEKLLNNVKDESDRKYVRTIRSNAERMQKLIGELMDFRKAETGHKELKYDRINLTELLKCVLDNYTEFVEEKKIKLSVGSNVLSPLIWSTDYDCFEKILFNLISNAFKYVNEEGHIGIDVSVWENELKLTVENSGKGIEPEKIDSIFNRFKILDNYEEQMSKGRIKRTGIGLALTKSLVDLLDGRISVTSIVNERTVFTITFPHTESYAVNNDTVDGTILNSLIEDKPQNILSKIKNLRSNVSGRIASILVVDDEADIREFLKDILSDTYEVTTASDGNEALNMIRQKCPDLIISDILMPAMDGDELLKELKRNQYTSHIPFVFLSSKTAIDAQITGYEEGVDGFLTKPFHPEHLRAVVDRILANHKLLRNYYTSNLPTIEEFNGTMIQSDDKELLIKVTQVIEENIDNEDLSPKFISSRLAMSQMQFYRKIKSLCSSTPSEFVRKVRINYAAKLLRTTNQTVLEVMYDSGFNSKSYFYREFQKEFGVSPKEFAKSAKNKV